MLLPFFLVLIMSVNWPDIVKPVHHQVHRVVTMDADGNTGTCSAVVINATSGFALTAAHCLEGEPDMTFNGRHAKLVRSNRIIDLAVIRFKPVTEQAMSLAAATPPIGTPVAMAGFFLGAKNLHVQFGHISAVRDHFGNQIVIDGIIRPGDSGGAVLDQSGALVGMSNAYYVHGSSGLAIPIETIRDFVSQYLPK